MLTRLFKRKVKLVKYPQPMGHEEVAKVFRGFGSDKIWQELDTIIDAHLLSAVSDVSDSKLSATELAHASGRVDAISTLKLKIEEYKNHNPE